jgi:hypothetical protein
MSHSSRDNNTTEEINTDSEAMDVDKEEDVNIYINVTY